MQIDSNTQAASELLKIFLTCLGELPPQSLKRHHQFQFTLPKATTKQ